jgi:hypothetical protein
MKGRYLALLNERPNDHGVPGFAKGCHVGGLVKIPFHVDEPAVPP